LAPVTYQGVGVSPNMIGAGEHLFTFDGTSWQLLNPVTMIKQSATPPGNPNLFWINTSNHSLNYWTGSAWQVNVGMWGV